MRLETWWPEQGKRPVRHGQQVRFVHQGIRASRPWSRDHQATRTVLNSVAVDLEGEGPRLCRHRRRHPRVSTIVDTFLDLHGNRKGWREMCHNIPLGPNGDPWPPASAPAPATGMTTISPTSSPTLAISAIGRATTSAPSFAGPSGTAERNGERGGWGWEVRARAAENPPKNWQLFPLDRVLPVCKPAAMMNVSEKQFSFACPASMNGRHDKEQFPVSSPPERRQ